jgi:bifunctional non-homologous end joining protein LigD
MRTVGHKHLPTRSKQRAEGKAAPLAQLDAALAARSASAVLEVDGAAVTLTNLQKIFFPEAPVGARTKGDLLRYYLSIAPVILPHLHERPVVLTRYPNGAGTKGFYVQRAPEQRPAWTTTCTTSVKPPKEIEYLTIESTASLLWVANLAGFEIHPWYSRCSATTRPDFLVIDLDPVPGVKFAKVRTAALHVHDALDAWGLPGFVKTSGASGLHVFIPIVRGPAQEEVHDIARDIAHVIESQHPHLFTTEYRIAARPSGRVLLDHNQNALGHHLAGAYSVRPTPTGTVSAPLDWAELADGASPRDFTIATVPPRLLARDDPWSSKLLERARVDLDRWRAGMVKKTLRAAAN